MSQLMHMRQRIKAVQTIKKITHAMRLISMSTHARMKRLEKPLENYSRTINELISKSQSVISKESSTSAYAEKTSKEHALVVLIGSQKGLCGNFNTMLMQHFNTYAKKHAPFSLITVGKRATQLAMPRYHRRIIAEYNTFGMHNLLSIAGDLLRRITQLEKPYTSVRIIANIAPTFFSQKPHVHQIIPMPTFKQDSASIEYAVEQPSEEIDNYLTHLYLLSQIQYALFQSLLAEHAARFISMDSSTRNAETMLEKLQLDYNKLRQASITRELTELSAFFLQ